MSAVAAIVEGDGEVAALPVLLRRLRAWQTPELPVHLLPPIRVRRERFLNREDELHRHLLLAAAKCGDEYRCPCHQPVPVDRVDGRRVRARRYRPVRGAGRGDGQGGADHRHRHSLTAQRAASE